MSPSLIWTVAIICVFVAGIVRGMTGFGFAAIAVVGLGFCWPLPQVVPLVLFLEVAVGLMMVPASWPEADRPMLKMLVVAAAVGVPIGALALTQADVHLMTLMVYLLIGGLAVMGLARIRLPVGGGRLAPWAVGGATGALIAAFSIGGPLVVAWLSHRGLQAGRLRATLVLFFFCIDLAGLTALVAAKAMPATIWPLAASLLLPSFAGLWLGRRLFDRVSGATAERLVQWLLLALATIGLAGLLHG